MSKYAVIILMVLFLGCTPKNEVSQNRQIQQTTREDMKWSLDEDILFSDNIIGRKLLNSKFSDISLKISFENNEFIFHITDNEHSPIYGRTSTTINYNGVDYKRDIIIESNLLKIRKELIAPFFLKNEKFKMTIFSFYENEMESFIFDLIGNNFQENWSNIGEEIYNNLPIPIINFSIREFVDNFGDRTDKKYIHAKFDGSFSNSATRNSNAYLYCIISNSPYIYIREYRETSSNASFIGYIRINIRDSNGNDHYKRFERKDIHNGNIFLDDWIIPIFKTEGNIRIRISEEYGSEYSFDINTDGFNEIFSSLFP